MKGPSLLKMVKKSPVRKDTKKGDKATTANIVKADAETDALKKSKGKDKLTNLKKRYGVNFKKDAEGVFRSPDGKTPSELEKTYLKS